MGYIKVWGFLLGARVGRVVGIRVFRVTCRVGYMNVYGCPLGVCAKKNFFFG